MTYAGLEDGGIMTEKRMGTGLLKVFVKLMIVCYVVTAVILGLVAFVMWKMNPPEAFVSGGILFAYVISSFTGGFVLGKRAGRRKYLWGILFGIIYFVVIFAVSGCISGFAGEFSENVMTVMLLCVSGGMLGGMLS